MDKMSSKVDDKLTLSLRWGCHRETVLQSLESCYGDEDFVDMTLACEGQSVKAHKVVVSACSTHLKQLLKENPCTHPIIILKDVAMAELRCLLEFMYSGRVTVEQQHLERLLEAAKMLGIRGLAPGAVDGLEEIESDVSDNSCKVDCNLDSQQRLKRHRSESPTNNKKPRPVPPLQSILAQTLLTSTTSTNQGQEESASETSIEMSSRQVSSPPSTLAKLLAQSPASTLGSSHSYSLDLESNNAESNASKQDENGSVEERFQLKQEAVDLDVGIDNPTEALELEYQNPDFDETVDTDTYQHQIGLSSSSPYDSSVHERIGKATAFMLSLAKRANQNNAFVSSPPERKLSFHEPRPCPVCNKMYRDAATLRTHVAMMHPSARLNTSSISTANGEGGSESRLPFYEARPCSICGKMYRDAASLRTHMSIMHTLWRDGFECSCKLVFQTKHEMYQHRRSHGKLRDLDPL